MGGKGAANLRQNEEQKVAKSQAVLAQSRWGGKAPEGSVMEVGGGRWGSLTDCVDWNEIKILGTNEKDEDHSMIARMPCVWSSTDRDPHIYLYADPHADA